MIGLECLHATAEISERSDVIRAFPKRSKSSCNFARSAPGLLNGPFLASKGRAISIQNIQHYQLCVICISSKSNKVSIQRINESIKKSIRTSALFKYNNLYTFCLTHSFQAKNLIKRQNLLSVSQKVFSLRDGW